MASNPKTSSLSWLLIVASAWVILASPVRGQAEELTLKLPRPAAIWPAGPIDVVVAFNRPVDPAAMARLIGRTISYPSTTPGATESIRIEGISSTDRGRTFNLMTDPHSATVSYRLPVDGSMPWSYHLGGVEASWADQGTNPDDPPRWTGWLPFLDPEASQRTTQGSLPHLKAFEQFRKAGRLSLACMIAFPKGKIRTEVRTSGPIEEIIFGSEAFLAEEGGEPVKSREIVVESSGEFQFLSMRVQTAKASVTPTVRLRYWLEEAKEPRELTREQVMLPWAPVGGGSPGGSAEPVSLPNLKGGNPKQGEAIFYGDQAQCSRCHRVQGKGGEIGPDLTMIGKKGAAEIYRSIAVPSAAIDPKYVAFTVSAKDGRVASGIVKADGPEAILVSDTGAKVTRIARNEIDQIRPASASIMPVGLASALGEERLRDLIAFLTSPEAKP